MQKEIITSENTATFLTNEKFLKLIEKYLIIILACIFILHFIGELNIGWLENSYYSIFDALGLMFTEAFSHILIFGFSSILAGFGITIYIFTNQNVILTSRRFIYEIIRSTNIRIA